MENEQSVIQKATEYVNNNFGGDWLKAYNYYVVGGQMDENQLVAFLVNAGIGSRITRRTIAARIMEKFDTDKDGGISFSEFEAVRNQGLA